MFPIMTMNPAPKKIHLIGLALLALFALPATAQQWQVVERFPGGVPEGNWTAIGNVIYDTSSGYLDMRAGPPGTSTFRVDLPQTFTEGEFTVYFDFYLPKSDWQNQAGFGIGGPVQAVQAGWSPIGARNRFQTVNPWPQNTAKAQIWDSDIFGETEQGVWYNVWLLYDLDSDPMTVTTFTKKATDKMLEENLEIVTFLFDTGGSDDWSEITYFGFGVGGFDAGQQPPDLGTFDTLGLLADNIHVSVGENITLPADSFQGQWALIDRFDNGQPQANLTVLPGAVPSFDGDALRVQATTANAGLYVPLDTQIKRGSLTVSFDLKLPGGGLNQAVLAVIGEAQTALTGNALYGGNDRVFSFGTTSPQKLVKFGALTTDLLGVTQQDQWYHFWMVYDIDFKQLRFYSTPAGTGENPAVPPTEPTGVFALQTAYADLGYFVIGNWQTGGTGIIIDNLSQSLGANVSIPDPGDTPPPPPEPAPPAPGWNPTPVGWWTYGFAADQPWGYSIDLGFLVRFSGSPWLYQAGWGWLYHIEGDWFYSPDVGWIYSAGWGDFWHSAGPPWARNSFLMPVR